MRQVSISRLVVGVVAMTPLAANAAVIYQESGGVVAFEAEGYSSKSAAYSQNSNNYEWMLQSSANASGGSYMQVLPDTGVNHNNADSSNINWVFSGPTVSYDFLVSTAGSYAFYVRGAAGEGGTNSEVVNAKVFKIDAEGNVLTEVGSKTSGGVTTDSGSHDFQTGPWNILFTPPALERGEYYRLTIYMRHDGTAIDKLAGILNPVQEAPSNLGPAVSALVPEPAAMSLLGGLAALGLGRRRRRM
jgi:hypothetical protein